MRDALDRLAGLEGWRWVLAWVVASVFAARGADLVTAGVLRQLRWMPEDVFGQAELSRMWFGTAVSGVGGVAAASIGQGVLLRCRLATPGAWPIASVAGAVVATAVVSAYQFEVLEYSSMRWEVALGLPLLVATAVQAAAESVALRPVVPARFWVAARVGVALIALLPLVLLAGSGRPFGAFGPGGALFSAFGLLPPVLLGTAIYRFTGTRTRSDEGPLEG